MQTTSNNLFKTALCIISLVTLLPVLADSVSLPDQPVPVPEKTPQPNLEQEFFQLCDRAILDLPSPKREARRYGSHYYVDSYAVRALLVASDMTGKKEYLNCARQWADRMVNFQSQMIPKGAYYMRYGRKPGEDHGSWYVADSSCIAMGVLATAVRCENKPDRERYFKSAQLFARLVMDNYIGPHGGIRNAYWDKFDGEWWCCSGVFASLCFLLHNETGQDHYLQTALKAVQWLNHEDMETTGPNGLKEQNATLPMYVCEAYSAGLPQLKRHPEVYPAALRQISWAVKWMSENTAGKGISATADYESQWGSKYGGLPFHLYTCAKELPDPAAIQRLADEELRRVAAAIAREKPELTQLAAFAMISYAQKLRPGAIYRTGAAQGLGITADPK
jgi:hypothetical protein